MKKLQKPKLLSKPTIEDFERYKSAMRKYDAERITLGIATREEVQRENTERFIPKRLFSEAKIDWGYSHNARKR